MIVKKLFGTVTGKKICILGFAFKANTNDTRESAAINICKDLLQEGALLFIHDPKVDKNQISKDLLQEESVKLRNNDKTNDKTIEGEWCFVNNASESFKDADAIVILTEWGDYFKIDWGKASMIMRQPAWIFDVRSVLSRETFPISNLNVWRLGDGS